MPRLVLIVTAILCLLAGGLGLWLGMLDAERSESDIISAAAALWSSETGNLDTSTCVAWSRPDGIVSLEVRCGMDETTRTYRFDNEGRLIRDGQPDT